MFLESKFKSWTILVTGLLLLLTWLLAYIFKILLVKGKLPPFGVIIFLGLFLFFWIWIVFGELRTKALKVTIQANSIVVSRYLGMGPKRRFDLSEFDGFKTSVLRSKYEAYEFLYLMAADKKIIKLSNYYHKNYFELKNEIAQNINYLGNERLNLISELKEIFV